MQPMTQCHRPNITDPVGQHVRLLATNCRLMSKVVSTGAAAGTGNASQ